MTMSDTTPGDSWGDHAVDITAISAIGSMAILGVHGYEPYVVVASIALGKRYTRLKRP